MTVSEGSTVTLTNNGTGTLEGTITLGTNSTPGSIFVNSVGSTTTLDVSGSVMLAGGGTLATSNTTANQILASGSDSLTNNSGNTIQGSGTIGNNISSGTLTLTNQGIINANQTASLTIETTKVTSNMGTLEAAGGGTLNLVGTFNNSLAGLILSTDSGSIVNLNGARITGGTLTTTSGGVTQNNGSATLDGSTSSPTISTGSTITLDNSTITTLLGSIIDNGEIKLNSVGSTTTLDVSGSVTMAGTGALVMSNTAANQIVGVTSTNAALTNGTSHTIEGGGDIGNNTSSGGFTLTNSGTILANQTTTLTIEPHGNTTNNGTFQANRGSLLLMNGTLTNYSPGTSTLTGGNYNVYSGTIELAQASKNGGDVITTNAATILLDGGPAKIADASGNDIVRGFISSNMSAASFTIQDGANLTTASTGFSNAGFVTVGASSTLTVGGSNVYVQSGGTTTLLSGGSVAVASGHSFDLNGGTLQGVGTITGNLFANGGTIMPGLPGSGGKLTVTGHFTDPMSTLDIRLFSPSSYSSLAIDGTASLTQTTLDLNLGAGFAAPIGTDFTVLTSSGLTGTFTNLPTNDETFVFDGDKFLVEYGPAGSPNDIVIQFMGSAVPEPASLGMLIIGMAGAGAFALVKKRRMARK